MACSGRVLSPVPTQNKNVEALAKAKEKDVADTNQEPYSPTWTSSHKETVEFLRIIKKSDYRVVDRLNHTLSKISILSYLLSSQARRESLMKILGATHVTKNITVYQFDGVVVKITAGNFLGFNDGEQPAEGGSQNKAPHISMKCLDIIISRVLVDT